MRSAAAVTWASSAVVAAALAVENAATESAVAVENAVSAVAVSAAMVRPAAASFSSSSAVPRVWARARACSASTVATDKDCSARAAAWLIEAAAVSAAWVIALAVVAVAVAVAAVSWARASLAARSAVPDTAARFFCAEASSLAQSAADWASLSEMDSRRSLSVERRAASSFSSSSFSVSLAAASCA